MTKSVRDFLIEAKRHTYAAQGDDASVVPLLPGSRQLEYGNESLFYRDVYFGVAYFVGQETVYQKGQPYWSMIYAGGVDQAVTAMDEVRGIYAFLRAALRQVSTEHIFRGPSNFRDGDYDYENSFDGNFETFRGSEVIRHRGRIVYTLSYSGGVLR